VGGLRRNEGSLLFVIWMRKEKNYLEGGGSCITKEMKGEEPMREEERHNCGGTPDDSRIPILLRKR